MYVFMMFCVCTVCVCVLCVYVTVCVYSMCMCVVCICDGVWVLVSEDLMGILADMFLSLGTKSYLIIPFRDI